MAKKVVVPQVRVSNALANFINSDDTKENELHENASAASVNDGEASASPDFINNDADEAELNDSLDEGDDLNWENESESEVPKELMDIPKKYWKLQTV